METIIKFSDRELVMFGRLMDILEDIHMELQRSNDLKETEIKFLKENK